MDLTFTRDVNVFKKLNKLSKILSPVPFDKILKDVTNRYSEQHRYYHTLEHVITILKYLHDYDIYNVNKTRDLYIIYMGALFHDIIYIPGSKINEQASADYYRFIARNYIYPTYIEFKKLEKIIIDSILNTDPNEYIGYSGEASDDITWILQGLDLMSMVELKNIYCNDNLIESEFIGLFNGDDRFNEKTRPDINTIESIMSKSRYDFLLSFYNTPRILRHKNFSPYEQLIKSNIEKVLGISSCNI